MCQDTELFEAGEMAVLISFFKQHSSESGGLAFLDHMEGFESRVFSMLMLRVA